MRTFLNHIKNETLDEIKTSLENLLPQIIQLSEFFQYSFVLILKRKCLVRASRVRSGESGTPSSIIYVPWNSRRYELGCDTPVGSTCRRQLIIHGTKHCKAAGFNSLAPGQNGRHFADNIFKCIFLNENFCISNKISLKFVPKGPIDNNPALV